MQLPREKAHRPNTLRGWQHCSPGLGEETVVYGGNKRSTGNISFETLRQGVLYIVFSSRTRNSNVLDYPPELGIFVYGKLLFVHPSHWEIEPYTNKLKRIFQLMQKLECPASQSRALRANRGVSDPPQHKTLAPARQLARAGTPIDFSSSRCRPEKSFHRGFPAAGARRWHACSVTAPPTLNKSRPAGLHLISSRDSMDNLFVLKEIDL